MSRFRISRRYLLGAAATTAVAGAAAAVVIGRDTHLLGDMLGANNRTQPSAAWLDGQLTGDDLVQARTTFAPLQPRVLELDLLWQWRRELAQEMANGVRAVAITRWDKAILLSGLAREASLPVRQTRIGHSLFQTQIG